MKILKGVAVIFVLSITAACMGVQADDYLTLVGVDIPGWNGSYTTKNVKKTIDNDQFVKTVGTTDNRGVKVLLKDSKGDQGTYKNLSIGNCVGIIGSDGVGAYAGTYNLTFKTIDFHVTTTEYTGSWLLDGVLYNSICK